MSETLKTKEEDKTKARKVAALAGIALAGGALLGGGATAVAHNELARDHVATAGQLEYDKGMNESLESARDLGGALTGESRKTIIDPASIEGVVTDFASGHDGALPPNELNSDSRGVLIATSQSIESRNIAAGVAAGGAALGVAAGAVLAGAHRREQQ